MPDKYVDSHATGGSNDGSSWANAYLSLTSATGVSAGQEIWLASNHAEAWSANTTLTFTNGSPTQPIRLVSVNSSTNTYEAGALLYTSSGSITIANSVVAWGITVRNSVYTDLTGVGHRQVYFGCTFENTNNGNGYGAIHNIGTNQYSGTEVQLIRSTLIGAAGAGAFITQVFQASTLLMRNCTLSGGANKTALVSATWNAAYSNHGKIVVEDMNLDAGALVDVTTLGTGLSTYVRRCKIKSTLEPSNANDLFSEHIIENCDDGTISVPPLGLNWYRTLFGDVKSLSTVYRTSGASDGETGYSWQMVSASTCLEATGNAINTPPLTRWVAGGSEIDITVYVASEATLNDDDVWIELSGPNNTANPNQTAQGYSYTSRAATQLTTPTALTTDSVSTWNGSGVSVKQKITHTYTPTEAGPVTIKVYLAKASTTIYVDPKIEVA